MTVILVLYSDQGMPTLGRRRHGFLRGDWCGREGNEKGDPRVELTAMEVGVDDCFGR